MSLELPQNISSYLAENVFRSAQKYQLISGRTFVKNCPKISAHIWSKMCLELPQNISSYLAEICLELPQNISSTLAVYPANCRSPRTRANSGELERTRANSARTRQRFANTNTPPNSGERSPEYAERSPEFGGVRPGSPEFARTPPRTGERFARKFVRGKKYIHF